MPELPEVETVVRGLKSTVIGRTISRVTLRAPKASTVVSRSLAPHNFESVLAGREILDITRRGKNILISLSGEITLWGHLKMTGHFFWKENSAPVEKHDLVIFDFVPDPTRDSKETMHLRFHDYRRFGRLRIFRNDELWKQKGLAELGPEPLEIKPKAFAALCLKRPRMIKAALLDQSFLAGIGNIYADESLHLSKIHPKRLTTSLSEQKLTELHHHIQKMLKRAIKFNGTSVSNYAGVNGQTGAFQKFLHVYGNAGEPCQFCGKPLVRQKIGARSAHFCPRCQRLK
jgi:formamidopyrimidine-DNA glycosylase